MRWLAGVGMLAMLAGCGGGGGGDAGGGSVTVVTTPTPSPTASPTPAVSPTPTPSVTAAGAARYEVEPDVATCRAGVLRASVKADVLARLNAIRALHRLPPVTYADADDQQTAESSLMMVANSALDHTPPANWRCYTAVGAAGAGSGNLFSSTVPSATRMYTDDQYLGGWLTEGGSADLGHRRWMLDPFLSRVSYGRVSQTLADGRISDAATLKVFNFTGGAPVVTGIPGFVAYPHGDYPARYFTLDAYLSFSVVGSTAARGNNGAVSFAGAAVTVTAANTTLPITDLRSDNAGYGLPNNLQWRVTGLQANTSYTVRITGVRNASASEYSYSFRVVP